MWIGLTIHSDSGTDRDLYPGYPLFYVEKAYTAALTAHGMDPVLFPVIADRRRIRSYLEKVQGLLVTGGGRLAPPEGEALPDLKGTAEERYVFERLLLEEALASGMPVLGICRGAQMINEVLQGSLINLDPSLVTRHQQDIEGMPGWRPHHRLKLTEDSRVAGWIGATDVTVNSFHRQAVHRPGRGLRVTGRAPEDGVAEVLEGTDHPWLIGLQFHPERLCRGDVRWSGLFCAFREAAKTYRFG